MFAYFVLSRKITSQSTTIGLWNNFFTQDEKLIKDIFGKQHFRKLNLIFNKLSNDNNYWKRTVLVQAEIYLVEIKNTYCKAVFHLPHEYRLQTGCLVLEQLICSCTHFCLGTDWSEIQWAISNCKRDLWGEPNQPRHPCHVVAETTAPGKLRNLFRIRFSTSLYWDFVPHIWFIEFAAFLSLLKCN